MEGKEMQISQNTSLQSMSPAAVIEQIKIVQNIMASVMKDGEHYGKVPGCGEKKVLLKAGAEKLGFTFRLSPEFEGERDPIIMENGHREYIIKTTLRHIESGKVWGQGLGSCSTMEKKYRYRSGPSENTGKLVPKEYWDMRKSNPEKAQEVIGGKGFVTKKEGGGWFIFKQGESVENDCIADQYNTVLKMAKKRSVVDATITATATSDIFTQDLEELNDLDRPTPIEHPTPQEDDGRKVYPSEPVIDDARPGTFKAPPLPQEPNKNTWDGILIDVETKTGKGNKGPWTRYGIILKHNNETIAFGTFSDTIGVTAVELKGKNVTVEYSDDGKYKTVISIKEQQRQPGEE
jgi:hypothetical protein